MLNYMLSMPGIQDPQMEDGTNSFAMALAQRSRSLVRSLLSSNLPSRTDQEALARAAILELDMGQCEYDVCKGLEFLHYL